jgi:lysine-N-methylase
VEKSISLSCPEACRQILFRDNPIIFFTEEESLKESTIHGSLNTSEFKNDSEKYFWDIRIFTIQVLQIRELTIEERMGVLALFFHEIDSNKNNNISDIIVSYKNDIENGKYCGFIQDLVDIENETKMQLIFVLRICGNVLNKISKPGYLNNLKYVLKGLNLDGNDYNVLKSTYIDTRKGVYNSLILENSTVYENYLVNYVYKTLFPKTDMSLFDIYLNLLLNFAILRFNIIGLCAYYGSQMDKDKLVYLVSNFAKMTEHSSEIIETLNRFAYANNLNNIDDILLLIGQ